MNAFYDEPPKNQEELNKLLNFPSTVTWKQKAEDGETENISNKIIRNSPNENTWVFSTNYENTEDGTKGKIEFEISLDDKGQWNSKIKQQVGFYDKTENNINELLSDFSVSSYSLQGEFSNKFSATYEKSELSNKSKRNENDLEKELYAVENYSSKLNSKNSFHI